MNYIKYSFFTLLISTLAFLSCKKQTTLNQDLGKAVQLSINGSSPDSLEYLINDKVVAVSPSSVGGAFQIKALFSVKGDQQELQIRKKGSTEIIQSKTIPGMPFNQSVNCYYDGIKLYDQSVLVTVKAYAEGTSVLDFILDGKVIGSGRASGFPTNLSVILDKGETREVQIRKQGETNVLLSKTITDAVGQKLSFYYDGTKILNLNVPAPANPLHMGVAAKFETTLGSIYQGPVDFVFFTSSAGNITPANLRISIPADGSFSEAIALPPLSDPVNDAYLLRIYKSGTADISYNTDADFKPVKQADYYFNFTPGISLLFVLKDQKVVKTTGTPASRGTTYSLIGTDISQFFR